MCLILEELFQNTKEFSNHIFFVFMSGFHVDKVCKNLGYAQWIRIEVVGFSGGIWVFWAEISFSLHILKTNTQFVSCMIEEKSSRRWLLNMVYASSSQLRRLLWEELNDNSDDNVNGWVAICDFNSIISTQEQSGYSTFNNAGSKDFNDWIYDNGLIDVQYK